MSLACGNILCPTDFSPLSLAAIDTARDLARTFGATLHVVHVAPLLVPDSSIAMQTAGDMLMSSVDIVGASKRDLDNLVKNYCSDDEKIRHTTLVGTAWRELCEYAKRESIDVIVVATHGRTGLKHVLLGSVAERIVQHAPCAVLVVKSFPLASAE